MKISEHISYNEATRSSTAIRNGIDNTPPESVLSNMRLVANVCFEPLRNWYRNPITINSFYRCPDLNKRVGGSKTSQHMTGEAIDIDVHDDDENRKLFDWCKDNLEFDQLIWEYGGKWVHISYRADGNNRNQVLNIG